MLKYYEKRQFLYKIHNDFIITTKNIFSNIKIVNIK